MVSEKQIQDLEIVRTQLVNDMWDLVKKLAEVSYPNAYAQRDDAIRVGQIAQAIKDIDSASSEIRKVIRECPRINIIG